jgi:predicted DNA-binding transcriptional regulator AlpA
MPIKTLLDQKSLARLLGLNPKTIARWRSGGKIPQPFLLVANRPYWTSQQIEQWQSNDKSNVQPEEHSRTLANNVQVFSLDIAIIRLARCA